MMPKKRINMRFLLNILFLIFSVHNLYAQPVNEVIMPQESITAEQKISRTDKQENKINNLKSPKPNTKKENILSLDNSDSIFPKTKTNILVNPTFKSNSFRVQNVFKQDKNIAFQPRATSGNGINSQFLAPRKSLESKDIPKELKHLFLNKK